jgi:hypothetical protein
MARTTSWLRLGMITVLIDCFAVTRQLPDSVFLSHRVLGDFPRNQYPRPCPRSGKISKERGSSSDLRKLTLSHGRSGRLIPGEKLSEPGFLAISLGEKRISFSFSPRLIPFPSTRLCQSSEQRERRRGDGNFGLHGTYTNPQQKTGEPPRL